MTEDFSDLQGEDLEYQDVDLDAHLAKEPEEQQELEEDPVLAQLTDAEKAVLEKVQQLQMSQDHIIQTFEQLENKPSQEYIDNLKAQVGDVFLVSLSEKENFLFRPLKRMEWRNLLQKLQKLDDMKKSEAIVMKGVMWPELSQVNINALSAGTIDTVKELILQASNFMPPEVALQLVRKL